MMAFENTRCPLLSRYSGGFWFLLLPAAAYFSLKRLSLLVVLVFANRPGRFTGDF
jgi:hypothetical protein